MKTFCIAFLIIFTTHTCVFASENPKKKEVGKSKKRELRFDFGTFEIQSAISKTNKPLLC